jgi:hypothetical protein
MATQSEHGRLIAAAAKAALGPLGCKRKGQSRLWYSDERFWLICIEFQPSGWSKGSYLNVGPMWMWHPEANFGFSESPWVDGAGFIAFESADQFIPLVASMAERAAQEVLMRREQFKSLRHIYAHLMTRVGRNDWLLYDATIAAGLVGDTATASQLFGFLEHWSTHGYDWEERPKSRGAALAKLLDDPVKFRTAVLTFIAEARAHMNLPPEPDLWRTMGSIDEA